MGKKLKKSYYNYNLLIVQNLRKVHYQILLIILLTEFIKLNSNIDTIIKNAKYVELNIKIVSAFLNTQTLKML